MTTTTRSDLPSITARETRLEPSRPAPRPRRRRRRMSADLGRDLGALAMVTVLTIGVLAAVVGAFAGAVHVLGPTLVGLLG